MADKRPTKKQREMLTFVENFISGHGYGPSYREIRAGLGYKSVATVAVHIDNLIAKEYLRKKDHSARSLEVVGKPDETLAIRGGPTPENQEKWLIKRIEEQFVIVEQAGSSSIAVIDELYVLVGALKILGFNGAAQSFVSRINAIKKSTNA